MAPTRTYENDSIRVHWDSSRCIHTAVCLRELPSVFDTERRPWIDIDAASADEIAAAVEGCPTGALRYERLDGAPGEEPRRPAAVIPIEDGPLMLLGDLRVEDPDGNEITRETRLTLCRCGQTRNQPFCDNSHLDCRFAPGEPNEPADPLPEMRGDGEGPVRVIAQRNESLRIRGDVEVFSPAGEKLAEGRGAYLCRCGQSANKPFCDGSHERAGFESRDPDASRDRLEAETPAAFTPNEDVPDPREAAS